MGMVPDVISIIALSLCEFIVVVILIIRGGNQTLN